MKSMLSQYHCACCNKAVNSTDKVCPKCGSHHIKSPYSLWLFGVFACLIAAITFKVSHVYFAEPKEESPNQVTLLDVLNQDSKNVKR